MLRRKLKNFLLTAFAVFCVFGVSNVAHAATVTFDNSGGNSTWEGPTNWDTNTVPTAADTVIIGTTVAVVATSTIDFSTLQVGNGTLTASLTFTGNIGTGGSITIKNAGTLIQNNAVEQVLSGTLTIESGGTLKSGNNTTAQSYIVDFSVATIALNAGGTITTDALGYDGGAATVTGSGPGAGVGGVTNGSGAAHAGNGGVGDVAGGAQYCTITDVATMGSGGGGGTGKAGGAGGGLIILTASGTATLAGVITADGTAGAANSGGGGAGGGIKITANIVAGSPSSLTATGGNAGSTLGSGAGAGGCIEVVYTTSNSLSASTTYASAAMTASAGTTGNDGGPGVFYIKQVGVDGDMVIKNTTSIDSSGATTDITSPASINNLYLGLASTTFDGVTINTSFTFSSGSHLRIASGKSFTLDPSITSMTHTGTSTFPSLYILGTFNATGLSSFASTTLTIPGSGTWNNASTFTSNADTVISLHSTSLISNTFTSLNSGGTFTLPRGVATTTNMTVSGGTMTLSNFTTTTPLSVTTFAMTGGTLTHAANTTTQTHVINISATTITLSSTSTISADSLGYTGGATQLVGNGPGAGSGGASVASGGAHAGNGGTGAIGTPGTGYCVYTDVQTMGSGGGGGNSSGGGNGGGLIILNASGTATLAGTFTADGATGGSWGGGGAGGGIKITADTITGIPAGITATGGVGSGSGNGNGGGGCVQLTYTTANSLSASVLYNSATTTVSGAGTGVDGGAGVLFVKQSAAGAGDLVIKNASLEAAGATTDITSPTSINNLYLGLASTTFNGVTVNTSFTFSTAALRIASGNSFTLDPSITSMTHTGTTSSFYILGTLNSTGLSNFASTTLTIPSTGTWNNAATFTSNADTIISVTSTSNISNTFTSLNSAGTFSIPRGVVTTTNMTISGGTMTLSNFTTTTPLSLTTLTMTGGTLTHAANTTAQTHTVNIAATTLTMSSTSTISADGLGYTGGTLGGNGNGPGPGIGNVDLYGSGGGHAGNGGTGTSAGGTGYCTLTDVGTMGSSGGGGNNSSVGGDGGGLILLNISGTATVAGTITADGGTPGTYGGGGGGGGIKITADTIAGTPTSLTATGAAAGTSTGGAGGGGCIQLVYTTANSLSASTVYASSAMTAGAGTTGVDGGPGVIFVKQSAAPNGDLVVKNTATIEPAGAAIDITSPTSINNLYLGFASTTFSGVTVNTSLTFSNGSVLRVAAGNSFTLDPSITSMTHTGTSTFPLLYILGTLNATGLSNFASTTLMFPSGGTWNNASTFTSNGDTSTTLNSTVSITNPFTSLNSAGTFSLPSGVATTTDMIVSGGTMTLSNFTTTTPLSVSTFTMTGGTLTHSANTTTQTHVVNVSATTLTMSSTSTISADSLGYTGGAINTTGNGLGPGVGIVANYGGGGAHAGNGGVGVAAGGSEYCTYTDVETMGSGGGGGNGTGGGDGGGLIILTASGTATLRGTLTADGSVGGTYGGGGAGGGIKVTADTIAGIPTGITATGAAGGTASTGTGGGGCVQLLYTTANSLSASTLYASATTTVSSAGTGKDGGPGVIFVKQSTADAGDLLIKNASLEAAGATTDITSPTTIDNLYISYASTTFSGVTVSSSITFTSGTVRVASGNSFTLGPSVTSLTKTGTVTIPSLYILGTLNATGLTNFSSTTLTVLGGGTWNNASTFTSNADTTVTMVRSSTVSNTFTSFSSSGALTVTQGASFPITDLTITAGTVTLNNFTTSTALPIGGTLSVTGGTLTHTANTSSQTHVLNVSAGTITIGASGTVSANGKGFSGGAASSGSGQGPGGGVGNATAGGGGGYGGIGSTGTGGGAGGAAYCTVTNVERIGSGGGARTTGVGGAGGGLIILDASGTVTISGTVAATGSNGTILGGGGSGGGVKIRGAVVAGTPASLTAIGGNGATNGGGGGGGCVQVAYTTSNSIATATLTKGTGGAGGANGLFGSSTSWVTVSAISGSTSEAGGTATFTVVLTAAPAATVEIAIASSDTTEGTVNTTTLGFSTTDWNIARTVTVTGVNDDVDDGDIGYTITTGAASSTDGSYAGFDASNVSVTNTDNDTVGVTVTQSAGTTDVTEGAATDTYTIVLNTEPTADINIVLTPDADSTVSTSSIRFNVANWNVARTVTVTAVDDAFVEGAHTSTITHSATSTDLGYNAIVIGDLVANVTDNEGGGEGVTITESAGALEITEGGATDTYTIVLNTLPTASVFVNMLADADSTLSTTSIIFTTGNWNVAQTVTVTAVDDAFIEGAHVSTITHSATSTDLGYDAIVIGDATADVTDNDSAGFTVSAISGDTTEAGGTATFTVVLTSQPTGIVTTTVHSNDTTEGTITTSTLVFDAASWNLARTVTVTGIDDVLVDGNIAYNIILDTATSTDDVNYAEVNPADVVVTNTDNDAAGITVVESAGTTDITEGGATDTYTIVLNSEPSGNVAVSISPDVDSTVSTSSIVFTVLNWNVAQTITVTAVNDAISEGVHTSTLTHSATSTDPGYDGIAIVDVVANVTDNDTAGFTVSLISASTTEAGGTGTFTVVLNSQPTGIVTSSIQSFDTTEGTITTSTLVFSPSDWNLARTITVTGVDDTVDDGDIAYSIVLDPAESVDDVNYNGVMPGSVDIVNIDNDTAGVTVTESDGTTDSTEGGATDTYTIVLNTEPTGNVAISISPDAQSTVSTSSIVFTTANWNTPQTITLTAVNDLVVEGAHTSTVTQSATSTDGGYDAIAIASITANITDNDSAGFTVSLISASTTEAGGTATFTVVLNSEPTGIVTTTVHSNDTTEGTIATSTLVFSPASWNLERTVTVTGADDILADGNINYSIILDTATSTDDVNYAGINPSDVVVTNIDNDVVGITLVESGGTTDSTEGGATDTYTIVLNTEPSANVAVSLSADADSTVSTSSIVFTVANWNVAQTLTVTAVNDVFVEGAHFSTITHSVTSTDPGYDGIAVADVVANITDNDSAGFTVSVISGDTTEAGGTATFTVVLNSQPTGVVTTTVHSSDTTEGTLNTSTLVFDAASWNLARTVTVTGINDLLADGNIAYSIILDTSTSTDDVNYDGINPADVAVNNIDNDTVGITVTESAGTTDITEGGATDTYTLVLNTEPTGNVAVSLSADADSTVSTSSIVFTIANWDTAQTITVTAVNDAFAEGAHSSTITHSATSTDPGYDGVAINDVVANITDNESVGFSVSAISGNTTEAGVTATFTVVLNSQPTGVVTTTVHSSDTSEGTITTSTLVFSPADWNLARTITVTGIDDSVDDGNIAYSIILDTSTSTDDVNYDGLNPADVAITNTDNDTSGVTVVESGGTSDITEGGATDSYTIVLNSEPTGDVAVSISADADSTISTSSIVFTSANWNTAQTITVTAVNDALAEGDHTSTLSHVATSTDLGYEGIAIADVVANVTDNDAAAFDVSVISGNTTEAGGTATFTVVLLSPPSGVVTTTVHSSDESEGTVNTSTLVFDATSWNLARTVTVTGVNDLLVDGNIAYSIILDTATSTDDVNYNGINPADVAVNNTDNDIAGITLTESAGTTDITEGGATDSYTLVLNSEPTGDVTVNIAFDAQATISSSSIVFSTLNWNVAQTIVVAAANDNLVEGGHTATLTQTVTSTDPAYDGMVVPDVVATVTDNDTAGVTVTQSAGTTDITEGAATDSYTLVLTSQPSSSVSIAIDADAQSTVSTSSIIFSTSTWNIAQTITVTAVDDALAEGVHASAITHTASSADVNYDAIVIADVNVNITDNETDSVLVTESGGATNITEGGATDSYTLVLGSEPSDVVYVSIGTDADATVSTSSIQFSTTTWNIPQTITVTAVNDGTVEGAHSSTLTHTVTSTDLGYDAIVVADVTANVTDNDVAGVTRTQSGGTTNIAEAGAADSYTLVLNSEPTNDVTITVTPDAQSTVSTSSIVFTPTNWNIAVEVTVTAEDDLDIEGPHTSTITHSADSLDAAYNAIVIADVTANIIDNDTAGVTVTESTGTTDITEGGVEDSYEIVLNALPTGDVTISITPDANSTISTSSLVFNIANWNIPRIVTTTAVDDAISQGLHLSTITHTVASADLNYNEIATSDVVANVTDNDTAGITVSLISGNTSEAGASSTYTVVLNSEPTDDVLIPVSSSNMNEGTVNAASLTFTSLNWNTPQTIVVTGVDDLVDDADANYSIVNALASSTDGNYHGLNPDDVAVINIDNDTAGVSVTQSAGTTNVTEGGITDSYTLVLDTEPTNDVTITITPDAQSTVSTSSIVFTSANWNVAQTVTAIAVNDDIVEDPHDSTMSASVASLDAAYNGIAIADITVHITDNDSAGFTVSLISGDTTEAGGTATFTVVLNSEPTGPVTTSIASSDLTEASVNTTTLVFDAADWDIARTVIVTGGDDYLDDGDIDYTLVLDAALSADGNYNGVNPADVTATNIDDDGVGVNVVQSAGSSDISEAGATDSYTIVLGSEPTADVVITLTSDAQSSLSTSSITFTSSNWNSAVEVTITAVDDSLQEGNHNSTLTQSALSADGAYNAIAIGDITVHITDNDNIQNGGGGGAAPTIPSVPLVARFENSPEESDQVLIFTTKDTEFVYFPSVTHRVIRVSATSDEAVLVIESDPIIAHLTKDVAKILDTDKNGIPDLRVVYDGLVGKNPKFTFTELQELVAVSINNGATQTFSRMVHMQFNVTNASQVAISNNPDFSGATFQTFTTSSVWGLSFGDGEKNVYVRFRSKSGGTFDTSATINLVHSMIECSLQLGRAYKSEDSNAVYYITSPYDKNGQPKEGSCTKRAFKSSPIFFTYFASWGDVKVVAKNELNAIANDELGFMPRGPRYTPQNGTLMKIVSDPNVYLLVNDQKRVIASEDIFKSLGFQWNQVEDVAPELLDTFTLGSEIVENRAPSYSVIQYADSPRLYFLEKNPQDDSVILKRYIASESAWKSLDYRIDRVIRLPASTVYPDGTQIGEESSSTQSMETASPGFTFTHSLVLNDSGVEVEALQRILTAQGYFHHEVTGLYGPVTVEAVKAFQRAHGLEALGIVGPGTRSVLNSL